MIGFLRRAILFAICLPLCFCAPVPAPVLAKIQSSLAVAQDLDTLAVAFGGGTPALIAKVALFGLEQVVLLLKAQEQAQPTAALTARANTGAEEASALAQVVAAYGAIFPRSLPGAPSSLTLQALAANATSPAASPADVDALATAVAQLKGPVEAQMRARRPAFHTEVIAR